MTPSQTDMARNQWEPALALTWMPWKSCCSSSQSRRQSPSGPGGGGCIAAGPRAGGAESRGQNRNPGRPEAPPPPPPPPPSASGLAPPQPPMGKSLGPRARWPRPPPEPIRGRDGAGAGPHAPRAAGQAAPAWRAAAAPRRGSTRDANCVVLPAVSLPVTPGVNQGPGRWHSASNTCPLGKLLFGREAIPSLFSCLDFYEGLFMSPCLQVHRYCPFTQTPGYPD